MVIWRIDQPAVREINHDYPQIQFQKYDEVIVKGGGCVDTGGRLKKLNRTWKRYIDPSGDNSDRLYHGRISIPGATAGLVRIAWIEGQHLVINKFPGHSDDRSPLFLTLGYEDDNYPDNGYDSRHNDGTAKQCTLERDLEADHGKAWLEITIKHHDNPEAVLPRSPIPRAPLDLWWEAVDENYLPLNPDWWIHQNGNPQADPPEPARYPNSNEKDQKTGMGCDRFREGPHDFLKLGRSPKCTMQDPDVDEANGRQFPCHMGGFPSSAIHGHANWAAVTYSGQIYFDIANLGALSESALKEKHHLVEDGDYDWLFVTDGNRGLSTGSVADSDRAIKEGKLPKDTHALALEFSSRETIDHFEGSCWWTKFHGLVDHDPEKARDMVRGKQAVAIGLIGYDNEHGGRDTGARVELHPVWGLAIKDDSNPADITWAIFARNWGNEGFCSNGFDVTKGEWQHYLALRADRMTLFLPTPISRTSKIDPQFKSDYGEGNSKVTASIVDGGVLLTIQLQKPQDKNLFRGELHIRRE